MASAHAPSATRKRINSASRSYHARQYHPAIFPPIEYLESRLLLSDSSYYMPDAFGGTFYDTEKSAPGENISDTNMCWAATAANMLAWTRWGFINGLTTEDNILSYFAQRFSDSAGSETQAIDWFFTGEFPQSVPSGTTQKNAIVGGGFFAGINVGDYLEVSTSLALMNFVDNALHQGDATGLRIDWLSGGAHDVTCWGFTYDPSLSPSDPNYYTTVIVSDSDNDAGTNNGGANAPNTLQTYPIAWNGWQYVMPTFGGGALIQSAISLQREPAAVASQPNLVFQPVSNTYTNLGFSTTNSPTIQPGPSNLQYQWTPANIFYGGPLPEGITNDDSTFLQFNLINIGGAPSASATAVDVYADNTLVTTTEAPLLAPGQNFVSDYIPIGTLSIGPHTFRAVTDPDNQTS